MILISHRGNTNGKFESYENEPAYIDKAISEGFDVEVDIWVLAGILFLGHDRPQYGIDYNWLQERKNKLWIHCKNIEALQFCDDRLDLHYFWHENDTVTLTSQSTIWAYPGKQPIKNSIAVMPELYGDNIIECLGICSDFIKKYQK
jgi:hypothetical protein